MSQYVPLASQIQLTVKKELIIFLRVLHEVDHLLYLLLCVSFHRKTAIEEDSELG